ncbi:MAG: hypothetical protein INR71_05280 [Terriglobus roseus]|nr:hypothetical protein [Terriglobus roseus]
MTAFVALTSFIAPSAPRPIIRETCDMEIADWKTPSATGKERARWPALTRMLALGDTPDEPPRTYTTREKIEIW